MNAEQQRLRDAYGQRDAWYKWGPYLAERQWGTVREDYSDNGDAWNYFTHDHSRSRAYRWGEDGIAGISDDKQRLCFALALWNGRDPIVKERLFGLTNSEGNHGEDVKEYYFYLDCVPTHSYMKYLYKYPHAAYPYDQLVSGNKSRGRNAPEYELLDTGVFAENRYFDVFVEYAKASPEDVLIKITAFNRGPEAAELRLLPTLWFRNTWAWGDGDDKPSMFVSPDDPSLIVADAPCLGRRYLRYDGSPELLFTENETNRERLFGTKNPTPYVKDGVNNYLVNGCAAAVNPERRGTKCAIHYRAKIAAGKTAAVRLRLTDRPTAKKDVAGLATGSFNRVMTKRLAEADEFYRDVTPPSVSRDAAAVMRQALSGMLLGKQYYRFDVRQWIKERGARPSPSAIGAVRNKEWIHMVNDDIISMPDKWEYPWFAAWDLAFHALALDAVDPVFAKEQLQIILRSFYLHPSGQIPAYEWNFSDVNPPVHAWATLFLYRMEQLREGKGDIAFLKSAMNKLLLNFTWWVNRKDVLGNNVFAGGFLGLDNIGVFDRSAKLPDGGTIEQADGTAWMALYCQNMFEISLELATVDPIYEEMAIKFLEHFFWIATAMDRLGDNPDELWDETDGFFYDVLKPSNGVAQRIKVRSMVGLLPLCAVSVIEEDALKVLPNFKASAEHFFSRHVESLKNIHPPTLKGYNNRHLLSILNEEKLRRVLARMLDEERFLSPFGVRSLSKWHKEHPYVFAAGGSTLTVEYLPAESNSGMFGGNSNWRGPIWVPVNLMIVRALLQYYLYYGDNFMVECPTGSGKMMNLFEVAREIADRLIRIFLVDANGQRPVYGGAEMFKDDPLWRDHILFYEYFHGDNGTGLGASHQTGWTGCVAKLIQLFGAIDAKAGLAFGRKIMASTGK